MDKKKKMMKTFFKRFLMVWMIVMIILPLHAQDVEKVKFYGVQTDDENEEITLFLKFLDKNNKGVTPSIDDIKRFLTIKETKESIDWNNARIKRLASGNIPGDMTFSVLVDLNIPQVGLDSIYNSLKKLVENAPDGCVYVSFFGGDVTSTELITTANYTNFKKRFVTNAQQKWFYDAVYCKLAEFNNDTDSLYDKARLTNNYQANLSIAKRANEYPNKSILLVFTECSKDFEFDRQDYRSVTKYQRANISYMPKVYAFYYTGDGTPDDDAKTTLDMLAHYHGLPTDRKGKLIESNDMDQLIQELGESIGNEMYDYAFTYKAMKEAYDGDTDFKAQWGNLVVGDWTGAIGTKEHPWPQPKPSPYKIIWMVIGALLATLLTIAIFVLIMKALIPWVKSKTFAAKYYKKYVPEENVQRRVCHYCKQDLQPGQMIVTKCKHYMHIHCWKINNYKCAEYGQNCNEGIQEHVEWNTLFTKHTLRDNKLTIAGIIAALVGWAVYKLTGEGGWLNDLSQSIVNTFYKVQGQDSDISNLCISKVSSFMMIGLLLGFFLSLVFRYFDDYRTKNWKILLKIFGLSLLSGLIGMAAFALGGCIYCTWIPYLHTASDPWYCSLPAYLLFSVCAALSLTIKSSVPVKSALLGGLCSAVIGFLVLRFAPNSQNMSWLPMLLNFIIYGGGLGASLVTVRALAEKYFLVIQNGVKAGQRIPIHKWMNATGGGNKVTIGMTGDCEIQMNWEKSNKVAKEHAQLYIDPTRMMPVIKPLANGVVYNTRAELPVGKPSGLSNGDTFKIGDTIFKYEETD